MDCIDGVRCRRIAELEGELSNRDGGQGSTKARVEELEEQVRRMKSEAEQAAAREEQEKVQLREEIVRLRRECDTAVSKLQQSGTLAA